MNRQCVNATGEFFCERLVDQAMACDAGLSGEGLRYDMNFEMRLTAGTMGGMPLMQVRFVDDIQQ